MHPPNPTWPGHPHTANRHTQPSISVLTHLVALAPPSDYCYGERKFGGNAQAITRDRQGAPSGAHGATRPHGADAAYCARWLAPASWPAQPRAAHVACPGRTRRLLLRAAQPPGSLPHPPGERSAACMTKSHMLRKHAALCALGPDSKRPQHPTPPADGCTTHPCSGTFETSAWRCSSSRRGSPSTDRQAGAGGGCRPGCSSPRQLPRFAGAAFPASAACVAPLARVSTAAVQGAGPASLCQAGSHEARPCRRGCPRATRAAPPAL